MVCLFHGRTDARRRRRRQLLGNLGDRIGRARAMGVSILFYSVFAGLGAFVQTCEQMLVLRFWSGSASAACGPMASPWLRSAGRMHRGRPFPACWERDQRWDRWSFSFSAAITHHARFVAVDFQLAAIPAVLVCSC